MLVNGKEMLATARNNGQVVYHFNINNLEWTKIILEKCNELKTPVIIGVSEGAIKYMGGYRVVSSLVRSLIMDLDIQNDVCLHLDHGSSFDSCKEAIDAGFTSVMIDASKLPLDDNIKEVKKVVDYAHKNNVTVEAELGHVGGMEDDVKSSILLADYDECLRFVKETNIDSFAPAIGTVHGIYKGELNIDFDLIKRLHDNLSVPLVMHGGSGLSHDILRKAVKAGITKINVNSDMQYVWAEKVREFIQNNPSVYDPRKIIYSGSDAMRQFIEDKINLLNGVK
jgi:fructose-1,6-bisphosphate aldolase class II